MSKTKILVAMVVVTVLVCLVWGISPQFRTTVNEAGMSITTWTPEAIQADPVGYSMFVESSLKKDQEKLQISRKEIARQMERLAKMQSEKSKLLSDGEQLADEFAEAITAGVFPVTVRNAEYTEEQIRAQLALIVAQVNGMKASLDEMNDVAKTAESEILKLVVNIEKTESQLAMLKTRREIFRTQAITTEGLAMIDEVTSILEGNQILLKSNPVGTIEDILNRSRTSAETSPAGQSEVDAYLNNYTQK